ncbi:hypothetical protein HK096_001411 [Nowakowskiella sp. JEL0078]|nr:hypothetical protein HK096_001411 [Nowakowskiella sp. JEL0078]
MSRKRKQVNYKESLSFDDELLDIDLQKFSDTKHSSKQSKKKPVVLSEMDDEFMSEEELNLSRQRSKSGLKKNLQEQLPPTTIPSNLLKSQDLVDLSEDNDFHPPSLEIPEPASDLSQSLSGSPPANPNVQMLNSLKEFPNSPELTMYVPQRKAAKKTRNVIQYQEGSSEPEFSALEDLEFNESESDFETPTKKKDKKRKQTAKSKPKTKNNSKKTKILDAIISKTDFEENSKIDEVISNELKENFSPEFPSKLEIKAEDHETSIKLLQPSEIISDLRMNNSEVEKEEEGFSSNEHIESKDIVKSLKKMSETSLESTLSHEIESNPQSKATKSEVKSTTQFKEKIEKKTNSIISNSEPVLILPNSLPGTPNRGLVRVGLSRRSASKSLHSLNNGLAMQHIDMEGIGQLCFIPLFENNQPSEVNGEETQHRKSCLSNHQPVSTELQKVLHDVETTNKPQIPRQNNNSKLQKYVGAGWWQGHFVNQKTKQIYGLMGTISENPPELHPCCVSEFEQPVFWTVTIIDYHDGSRIMVKNVMQENPNSDSISLTTDFSRIIETGVSCGIKNSDLAKSIEFEDSKVGIQFDSTLVKVGHDAASHIRKFFPKVASLKESSEGEDCIICIGKMVLKGCNIQK